VVRRRRQKNTPSDIAAEEVHMEYFILHNFDPLTISQDYLKELIR
jgi:hypothetical protein